MRRLVFDQSSLVHPVSESRGGTVSVTDKRRTNKGRTESGKLCVLYRMLKLMTVNEWQQWWHFENYDIDDILKNRSYAYQDNYMKMITLMTITTVMRTMTKCMGLLSLVHLMAMMTMMTNSCPGHLDGDYDWWSWWRWWLMIMMAMMTINDDNGDKDNCP